MASVLPPDRRSQFLERVASMLKLVGRFDDAYVGQVCQRVLTGLQSAPAA